MNKSRILVRFQSLNNAVDAAIESVSSISHIFTNMQKTNSETRRCLNMNNICVYLPNFWLLTAKMCYFL